jgi:hypothetical protein
MFRGCLGTGSMRVAIVESGLVSFATMLLCPCLQYGTAPQASHLDPPSLHPSGA